MKINDSIKEFIIKHSLDSAPNECGGIVLEDGVERCTNLSSLPEESCVMSFEEVSRKSKNKKIKAIYHSHVNDNEDFSWEDKAASESFKKDLILYCVPKKLFKFYEPNGFVAPFVGRRWIQGVFTCISIIEDYYRKNFNIEVKGYDEVEICGHKIKHMDISAIYAKSLYDKSAKEMVENKNNEKMWPFILEQSGFNCVNDFKKHDVILCRGLNEKWNKRFNINYAIHAGIYLGDGKILHHPYKLNSTIEKLDQKLKLSIHKVYRHNKLK
jgi:proteasome lid subunit RPN8/RPN11|tara:strand:+ start:11549 stop:12355 length:807 start_codon:yes stop_codon:yes gene_type:complete